MGVDSFKLTLQIARGDQRAFEVFYKEEYKKAVFYANQYVKDYELAEDIVQDSFAILWNKRESLDPGYPVQPYLYSIIRNNTINNLKRLTVGSRVKGNIASRERYVNFLALSDDTAQNVVASELNECITRTFGKLPQKISKSFIKSRILGMSYKEIAEEEGTSVKVVEYHITQALKIFREKLKDFLIMFFF